MARDGVDGRSTVEVGDVGREDWRNTDSEPARAVEVLDVLSAKSEDKGDMARGVAECDLCSSRSASRGVIGLGMPGT